MCVCVYRTKYLRSKWFWESSVWYSDVSLQELDHGQREGQLIRSLLHLRPAQAVLHHELGQVAHDLWGRGHLAEKKKRKGELWAPNINTNVKAFNCIVFSSVVCSRPSDCNSFPLLGGLPSGSGRQEHTSARIRLNERKWRRSLWCNEDPVCWD